MSTQFHRLAFVALGLSGCGHAVPDRARPAPASTAPVRVPETIAPQMVSVAVAGSTPVIPQGVTSFGAARLGQDLYVLGGYVGEPHHYSSAGQLGDLLRYDGRAKSWSKVAAIEPAQSVALVAHGGRLIRVGGMAAHNAEGEPQDLNSLADVMAFDPDTGAWTPLPPLPSPRSSHDAVVIGNVLNVVGGWTLAGDEDGEWRQDLLTLDLTAPHAKWTSTPVPFRRRALAASTLDGKLIVIGGIDSDRKLSKQVDVFDPEQGTWSRGEEFPAPAFGVAAVSVGESLLASGGDGIVYQLDSPTSTWNAVSRLAFPRFFHRMVAGTDTAHVIGGIRSMGSGRRARMVEELDPATFGTPRWDKLEFESPLPTKNRQGIALVGDDLFVFGGNTSQEQHDFGEEFFAREGAALDLANLSWRTVAPYPAARQTMSTFVTAWGHLISVGGFGHDGTGEARTQPEIYAYQPKKDAWQPVGALPGRGRSQFGLVAHDEHLWLFGGLDYDSGRSKEKQFEHPLQVLSAKIKAQGLEFGESEVALEEPRRAFAGAVLGDQYFVTGGMRDGFALVETCRAFSFSTQRWSVMRCPSRVRLSGQMVALGGRLYLAAGSSRTETNGKLEPDRSLEVYDPEEDRWTTLVGDVPIEPRHLRMLPYGNRLLMFSTHNEGGAANILLLDPGVAPLSGLAHRDGVPNR